MTKSALITGGSRGIGRGIAEALLKNGFNVAVNGVRDESQIGDVLTDLRKIGPEVVYLQGNIAETDSRKALIDGMKTAFGRMDVLVNNAGVAPNVRLDILEATEESYDRVMEINLKGPYFLTQLAGQWMIEQTKSVSDYSPSIININSISATVASPGRGEYCISKAGLAMSTQLWAVRLGEFGIPVYELRPGVTRTDMTSGVKEKYDKLIEDGLLVQQRWGTPEDVGKAAASLARGDFSYSTGQAIMVDGGLTLNRL